MSTLQLAQTINRDRQTRSARRRQVIEAELSPSRHDRQWFNGEPKLRQHRPWAGLALT